ncbi:MAG: short-chain fatty acid transporter [Gammaproteobacteria bacterium]|nr:MAG: short-chain fatty acid transporter [Gammaproteobacteria bacterium]
MLRQLTRLCVRYAERYIPNPYLYAVVLTFITVAAALIWTPSGLLKVVASWYDGIWNILAFAMQMALILVTGVTLADAPLVRGLLRRLASLPTRQAGAAITVFLAAAVGSWLNWGFGLVVGALVAREIAKRLRDVDFGFLVAAAYMGFMVWASGLSSSIALATATHGSALNIVEKVTGKTAGFGETIFTAYNLVPVVLLVILMPVALYFMGPEETDMKKVDPQVLMRQDEVAHEGTRARTFATVLEDSWLLTVLLVLMGVVYEWHTIAAKGFHLDINGFIFIVLMLGLLFHWRPIRYVRAFESGARTVGPILLQFPLYGGIMGIMTGTGLAGIIAVLVVHFLQHHHALRALGRRSLGGAGSVHDPGGGQAARRRGHHGHGNGHGRGNREHDPAVLGPADPRDRPAWHQGHHGLLRDRTDHQPHPVRGIAPDLRLSVARPREWSSFH